MSKEFHQDDIDDALEDCEPKIFDSKRYRIRGVGGRDQYVIVDEGGLMVTFPDNRRKNWNYQATATALTRIISITMQAGVDMEGIKKQLKESSMQNYDTPAVLLEAILMYEESDENK